MSSPSFIPGAAPRVAPNPWHAFGGIWRLTFRRFLTLNQGLILGGMLAVLALFAVAQIRDDPQSTGRFYGWTTGFYLTFLVPILAFLSGGGAMRDEMKSASVDYVLTRPVRRPAFLLFKFLSHLACTQVVFLLALGVLIGIGQFRHVDGLAAALPWMLLAQVVLVIAFTAFGFLCGVLSPRYLVLGLVYAGVVEAGVGRVPTMLNRLSMTHHVRAMLQSVLPGANPARVPELSSPATVGILLAFTVLMLAGAAAIFAQQELAGGRTGEP